MQLPFPAEPTSYHGAGAGPAIAMPPTPPQMLSSRSDRGGHGAWDSPAHAKREAAGVAWLGVAEKTATSTNRAGGVAAAAVAAAGSRSPAVGEQA